MEEIQLAVNGTLMRGLALNERLLSAGARFIRKDQTSDQYRLWSINDEYPAMQRSSTGGAHIQVEIWQMATAALIQVLELEPPGLCMGKIELQDKQWVFGILGEQHICQGMQEITQYGGWQKYTNQIKK